MLDAPTSKNGKKAAVFLRAIPASVRRVGWTTSSYGIVQALRLGTNVILARLLTPELFGIMLIVNTARTGIELLSDIGIGQNVVKSPRADLPTFLDTAWTLQVIRGLILMAVALLAAYPLGQIYDVPVLPAVIAIASLNFAVLGCSSVQGFVLKRRLDLRRYSFFEVAVAAVAAFIHILFAYVWPSIWALVWAGVVSGVTSAVLSHRLIPDLRHQLRIIPDHAKEIFAFGKWIFAASLLYFASTNFDRLYLAGAVPVAILGIYGIAKSLTDMISVLVVRLGDFVIFPAVAASQLDRAGLRSRLAQVRPRFLMLAIVAVAGFAAASDIVIGLLYDARYSLAALMLPPMAVAIWFGILSTTSEAILLGIGRPSYAAGASALKLGCLIVAVPTLLATYGLAAAIVAFAVAEVVRYLALSIALWRERVSFFTQDVAMTVSFVVLAMALRAGVEFLGFGSGIGALWFGNGAWGGLNTH